MLITIRDVYHLDLLQQKMFAFFHLLDLNVKVKSLRIIPADGSHYL